MTSSTNAAHPAGPPHNGRPPAAPAPGSPSSTLTRTAPTAANGNGHFTAAASSPALLPSQQPAAANGPPSPATATPLTRFRAATTPYTIRFPHGGGAPSDGRSSPGSDTDVRLLGSPAPSIDGSSADDLGDVDSDAELRLAAESSGRARDTGTGTGVYSRQRGGRTARNGNGLDRRAVDDGDKDHHGGSRRRANQAARNRGWHQQLVLEEGDLLARVTLYRVSRLGYAMYLLASLATAGLVALLSRWFPDRWVRIFGKRVTAVDDSVVLGTAPSASTAADATPLVSGGAHGTIWVRIANSWEESHLVPLKNDLFHGHAANVFTHPGATAVTAADMAKPATVDPASHHEPAATLLYHLAYFEYRCIRFLWDPTAKGFATGADWKDPRWISASPPQPPMSPRAILPSPPSSTTLSPAAQAAASMLTALSLASTTAVERRQVFGPNAILIPERSTLDLVLSEVLHPFYVFQVFSMILWALDEYLYYATCIFVISVVSSLDTLIETKRNLKRLRDMSKFTCEVNVYRSGHWVKVTNADLVPGDLFELDTTDFTSMPCDALLVAGDCIVNESMLTGESIPVGKSSAADLKVLADASLHEAQVSGPVVKSFLFCGTQLVRVRGPGGEISGMGTSTGSLPRSPGGASPSLPPLAMVVRTGFNTTKGSLIRSMLFPKPHDFGFYRDAFRFIGVLSLFALVGFAFSVYNFVMAGTSAKIIIFRALDLVTIIIPPALPATISAGTSFALHRLRRSNIFCISPNRVNLAGKIDIACFDKTGTLTEDGLDVLGVHLVDPQTHKFSSLLAEPEDLRTSPADPRASVSSLPTAASVAHHALVAMATCHGINALDNGEHIGDPLDLKMLAWTKWKMHDSVGGMRVHPPGRAHPAPGTAAPVEGEIGIIKAYEFVSELRRMSVVTRAAPLPGATTNIGEPFRVYCKGAPEVMRDICLPETLPADYDAQLEALAHRGLRVIALAKRDLAGLNLVKVERLGRTATESALTFLGFLVFENKLKPGSASAIETLRTAAIRCVMCTGDNVLTAISVSRECGIIDRMDDIYVPRLAQSPLSVTSGASSVVMSGTGSMLSANGVGGGGKSKKMDPSAGGYGGLTIATPVPVANLDAADIVSAPEPTYTHVAWESFEDPSRTLDPLSLLPTSLPGGASRGASRPPPYSLAVTGDVFDWMVEHAPAEALNRMLYKAQVFARMSPDQKQWLVEKLQGVGYTVSFTGDGSNDCGALKAADVGLSLSEAEASVAAPFTSTSPDVNCVVTLLREGRAAIVTAMSSFRFMALYSFIQFTSVTTLYLVVSNLGDGQFLYIDIVLILPLAITMARSEAYSTLVPKRPTGNLLSKRIITSLIGHVLLQLAFQLFIFYHVKLQAWYELPLADPDERIVTAHENTVVFLLSAFQYIALAVCFTAGPPYRASIFKNTAFIGLVFAVIACNVVLLGIRVEWVMSLFDLLPVPPSYQVFIAALAAAHFVISWLAEKHVYPALADAFGRMAASLRRGPQVHAKKYKQVAKAFKAVGYP
ncbi:hypothetical protein H9P43_007441 [Blastocladiella emersonii ATCC 22665]|nr:hypothetical protein H9P43_007441 [Blastocladiella emersonii ATCC 22665]